jgi:hypothetical protein
VSAQRWRWIVPENFQFVKSKAVASLTYKPNADWQHFWPARRHKKAHRVEFAVIAAMIEISGDFSESTPIPHQPRSVLIFGKRLPAVQIVFNTLQ